MVLKRELLDLIDAYVEEQAPIDDVVDWLASHVQAVADSGDAQLQSVNGEAWILISELDAELRDEQSVRDGFADLIHPTIESITDSNSQAQTLSYADTAASEHKLS